MLTIFSTPKPFSGHNGLIQRNALMSWKLLHPDIEVILFGDEPGTAEICSELHLRYEPEVERTPDGPPSMRALFDSAQRIGRHSLLCYSNCDIILGQDFRKALERAAAWTDRFLMVGRRWDSDIAWSVDFSDSAWESKLREFVLREGVQRLYYNIDYFAFPRGLYRDSPPLAVGRRWWDQWAVWRAHAEGAPVVDASDVVMAMHQNHDYSTHPQGIQGMWYGEGAQTNFRIAGGWRHLHTLEDATFRVTEKGIERCRWYWLAPEKRFVRRNAERVRTAVRVHFWHPLLNATRNVRHAAGLRRENVTNVLPRRRTARRHEFDR